MNAKESPFDEVRLDIPFEIHGSNAFLLGIRTDKNTGRSSIRILYERKPIAMTVMGDLIKRNNSFDCYEKLEAVGVGNSDYFIRENRIATVGELSHILEPAILERAGRYANFTQITDSIVYGEYCLEGTDVPGSVQGADAFSLTFSARKAYVYPGEKFILPVCQPINRDFHCAAAVGNVCFTISRLYAIEATNSQAHSPLAAILPLHKNSDLTLSQLSGRHLLFLEYASDAHSPLSFYSTDYLGQNIHYTQAPYKINLFLSANQKIRCVGFWENNPDMVEIEFYSQEYMLPSILVTVKNKKT